MLGKRVIYKILFECGPEITLIFSIIVTVSTIYIYPHYELLLLFIFLCFQVYVNWYVIYHVSHNATTLKYHQNTSEVSGYRESNSISIGIDDPVNMLSSSSTSSASRHKYWYCEKCMTYTYRPTRHCIACNKCFHSRDHHCFALGACIIDSNMGNFIIICMYTSMASCCSLTVLGPYLYEQLQDITGDDARIFSVIIHYCFPIALAQFIYGEKSCLLLVTIFDILLLVCLVTFALSIWKLFRCLTGQQKYYSEKPKRQSMQEIFGSRKSLNFIFPFDGLLRTRMSSKNQLKDI